MEDPTYTADDVEDDLDDDTVKVLPRAWLDPIIKRADLPQLTDLGGAVIIHNHLTCSGYTEHTYRRFPVAYRLVGRERRYRVADVVAYAKSCLDTPLRTPPQRARAKKRVRAAAPQPIKSAPARAPPERQHEPAISQEKKPDTAP